MKRLRFDTRIGRYNLPVSNSRGYVSFPHYPNTLRNRGGGRGRTGEEAEEGQIVLDLKLVPFYIQFKPPDTTSVVLNLCQPGSPGPRTERGHRFFAIVCVVYSRLTVVPYFA